MSANMLKLNQDKTELIIFAPKHQVKHFSDFRLKFDGTVLSDVSCVKNLGMYFDKTISMEQQASAITISCFQQIRNIGRIRSLISVDACRTLVSSLVISRQHVLSPEKGNMTLSRQFLSRYTGCPFITVGNTNFLYMCTKHSMARLLAIYKN